MTQQWKPISSAPKDGNLILLGCPDEGPDGRPALSLPGYWLKGWGDGPDDMGQDDGWVDVQYTDFYPGRSFGSPDYMRKGSQPTHWMPLPAAPGTPPASAQDDAKDAARWRFIRRKLCLSGNGDGTCGMNAVNLPASIPGWPDPGAAVAEFCDAAIDAAIASQQGEGGAT